MYNYEYNEEKSSESSESFDELVKNPNKKRFQKHLRVKSSKANHSGSEINYRQFFSNYLQQIEKNGLFQKIIDLYEKNRSLLRASPINSIIQISDIQKWFNELMNNFERSKKKGKEKEEKKKWTKEDVFLLIFLVSSHSCIKNISIDHFDKSDWEYISRIAPFTSGLKIKLKWLSMQKSRAQNNLWLFEEEELLISIINKYDKKNLPWSKIEEEFNKSSTRGVIRLSKHCREKWINHLNPDLKKGDWTLAEDLILLEESQNIGMKWASISKKLQGRNENSVKNRFFTLLKLHMSCRQKGTKTLQNELKEKVAKKIEEVKKQITESNENMYVLKAHEKMYLNKLDSQDFIEELPYSLSPKKTMEKYVTFSEESIENLPNLMKKSTRETLGSKPNLICSNSSFWGSKNSIPFSYIQRNPLICKNFSENKIDFPLESSLYEEEEKNELKKSTFFYKKSEELSHSLSKMSISSLTPRREKSSLNNQNPDKENLAYKKPDIGKDLSKQHSQTSIISLSEIYPPNKNNSKSITSSQRKSSFMSYGSSINSNKEKKLLIATINNLKSDESSFSGTSVLSQELRRFLGKS